MEKNNLDPSTNMTNISAAPTTSKSGTEECEIKGFENWNVCVSNLFNAATQYKDLIESKKEKIIEIKRKIEDIKKETQKIDEKINNKRQNVEESISKVNDKINKLKNKIIKYNEYLQTENNNITLLHYIGENKGNKEILMELVNKLNIQQTQQVSINNGNVVEYKSNYFLKINHTPSRKIDVSQNNSI